MPWSARHRPVPEFTPSPALEPACSPLRSGLSIVSGRDVIRQPVGPVGMASPSDSDAYLISSQRAPLPGIVETLIVLCQAVRSHRLFTIKA